MATIADELLADFEDSGSDQEDNNNGEYHDDENKQVDQDADQDIDMEVDEPSEPTKAGVDAIDEAEAKARVNKMQLLGIADVKSVASLMSKLEPLLENIAHYRDLPPDKQTKNVGSIEDNPEYKLLTQSNAISTSIDSEIILVHKFIRDHYSIRFPELERLVQNPLDYAKTVAIIGNIPMNEIRKMSSSSDNMVGLPLDKVLTRAVLLTVIVEASTTHGQELTEAQLQTVRSACQLILRLNQAKATLTDYVQSRMTLFAPNLTCLIGPQTAAQLINVAGGISGLAKTPACNLAPLGSTKQGQSHLATNVGIRHQGYLYFSPIIADNGIMSDLKKQALRIVSAKVVLAARVDSVHQSPHGSMGADLKQQCLDRLDKLQEPPPNAGNRALPIPDDKPARKRGGRRARKAKEATAMTDLRKAQNRMAFGKEEAEMGYGVGDGTRGMGMVGQQGTGQIRAQQIDQRTRAKLSKKNAGWGAATPASGLQSTIKGFGASAVGTASVFGTSGLRTSGVGGGTTAGTSTVAFTAHQGLELVDPKTREENNRKRKADEDRWFKGGTFTQVGGGTATSTAAAAAAAAGPAGPASNGGFKVPALPLKKQKVTST